MQSPIYYERRNENEFFGMICDHPFPAHVHDVVEIVCLTHGRLELTIAGSKLVMRPGDVAIAFPSVPHSYDFVSEDAQGLSLIFQPDAISDYSRTFRTLTPISPILVREDKPAEMDEIISRMLHISRTDAESPLRWGYAHLFVAYLFLHMPLQAAKEQLNASMACQVLQYIGDHYQEPINLENTARALGISRIHLSHICSQQLRINFRQHINALRINEACSLLRNPSLSITQVADAVGYANLRTFHRAFLSQLGMQPGQYRARFAGISSGD